MVEMDCSRANEKFRLILYNLRDSICIGFLNELREINRDVCTNCEEIANRLSEMPEGTREVVELYNYLVESRDSTMIDLKNRLVRSSELLIFLFEEQANFTNDDLKLNSRAITWPREMDKLMEVASSTIGGRKDFVEGLLKNRRITFETKISSLMEKIELFKKKDPPVLTMDEMERSTQEIQIISDGQTFFYIFMHDYI